MTKRENWVTTTTKNKRQKAISEPTVDINAESLIQNGQVMDQLHKDPEVVLTPYQPETGTVRGKLVGQAIYYVANDDTKSARKILISLGARSYHAKVWVKEEQAIQKRHPQEKAKYFNKSMPEEYKLINLH